MENEQNASMSVQIEITNRYPSLLEIPVADLDEIGLWAFQKLCTVDKESCRQLLARQLCAWGLQGDYDVWHSDR